MNNSMQDIISNRRDLGDPQCVFPESRILEAHNQALDTAHTIFRDDRLHGPMRPTNRQHCARRNGGYHAPCRLPEMAEVAVAMFTPELEGSQKEPPPSDSTSPTWSTTWPVRVCYKT